MERVNILGVQFDHVTMNEAVGQVMDALSSRQQMIITTANPEIVMMAKKEPAFMALVNASDLIVADGIGIIYGSKIIKQPLPERVAGFDMIQAIFGEMAKTDMRCYFLGAGPGIAEMAAQKMQEKHPGLKIAGVHDGYFTKEQIPSIIDEINESGTDFLMVGLGAPKQEQWIRDFKDQIHAKVLIGCGGSFDGMSGHVKRAPNVFIKLHLEWFYRLIKQPRRAKRMLQLPIFIIEMAKVRFKNKRN